MRINQNKIQIIARCLVLLGLGAGASSYAYTIPTTGLISHWSGDGNALDSAGSNNGSTVGIVSYLTGISGTGFGFGGSGYVTVPNNPSLSFSSALTIGLWYKSDLANNVYYGLIDKREATFGGIANYGINFAPGVGLGVYYNDPAVVDGDDAPYGSVYEASRYGAAPGPGEFHHLAATYSQIAVGSIQLETFIDGQLVRTKLISGDLANTLNSAPLTIGATSSGSGEFFQGIIDEITIYNRVLSAGEIQTLATVPEPTTFALSLCGLAIFLKRRRYLKSE